MAVTAKRASGVITAISTEGTTQTLTVTMDDSYVLDDEVGRSLLITEDSSSPGRYREITAFSSTEIIVDAPFALATDTDNVGPFRGLVAINEDSAGYSAVNEKPIAVSDSFVISATLAEAADGTDLVNIATTDETANTYFTAVNGTVNTDGEHTGGQFTIPDGVFVYDKNVTFQYDLRTSLDVQVGGMLALGKQNLGDTTNADIIGYTSDSCRIIDVSDSFIDDTYQDRGAIHWNGGVYEGIGSATFYRMYGNTTAGSVAQQRQSFRVWNVSMTGVFGTRVSGNYSVLYGINGTNNTSNLGLGNPLGVAVLENNSVSGSRQAFYIVPNLGGSTTIGPTDVASLTQTVFRCTGNATSTQTILNWDLGALYDLVKSTGDTDTSPDITEGTVAATDFEFVKDYKLDFTNSDTTAKTVNGKIRIHDVDGVVTSAGTIDTTLGSVAEQRLVKYDFGVGGARPNFDNPAVINTSTPYSWAALFRGSDTTRGSSLTLGSTELLGPNGGIALTFPTIQDANITQINNTTVDAYTEFETSNEAYDYQYKYKEDNMEMPELDRVPFSISGGTITPTEGSDNFTLDSTQTGDPLQYDGTDTWTLTTPSTGFLGGLSTTGTVTVDAVIKGDLEATTIAHAFTDGDTIMDGSITVAGAITLPDGTYQLEGADYGGCTFSASGTSVNLVSIGGTGSPTLNTGVTLTKQVSITVELEEARVAADTYLAAYEYTTGGTLVGTILTPISEDDDGNDFTASYSVDPDNVVRFACLIDGYKIVSTETGENETITLEKYQTNIMDKDAVSDNTTVQTAVDALIDGMTVTWDATNNYVHYVFANDDALTAAITDAETRNFIYILSQQGEFVQRVARQDIDNDSVDFDLNGIVVELNDNDTPIPYVHFSKASGGTSAIEPNSQVVSPGNDDQSTAITNTPDDEKVRFNKPATVVIPSNGSLAFVRGELIEVYNDEVKPRQNNISLGIPIS